jgi:hypothetical protein
MNPGAVYDAWENVHAHQVDCPQHRQLCGAHLGGSAAAQDQPQTPVDPNVQAQTVPVDPAQGSPQTDDAVAAEGEEIVVTGLRRSLQSAQNLKRNSDQIVDAVVARTSASFRTALCPKPWHGSPV